MNDDDGGLQFYQEWQQWEREREEKLQEALDAYLTALFEYYGNRREQS